MAESVIFTDNTATTFNNTATEQTFWSTTVPANTLTVTDALRVTCWGDYRDDTGSPQVMTFRLYFGATNVAVRDQQTASVGLRDACWQWYITMRGAVGLEYIVDQWSDGGAALWAPTPPAVVQHGYAVPMDFAFGGNNIGIDTTVDVVLKQTGQLQTADPNLEMTYYAARVEKITVGGGAPPPPPPAPPGVATFSSATPGIVPVIYVQAW